MARVQGIHGLARENRVHPALRGEGQRSVLERLDVHPRRPGLAGIDAVHTPISLLEPMLESADWPVLGRFDNEFVTFVNPCAVKGISIFLALADAFPRTAFAAPPMS